MADFPKEFLWGAATSSHQVEGLNCNNDWWDWELRRRLKEKSGLATRHYDLFRQDFILARQLKHNCHRFSIEWSRIQPAKDYFHKEEITHYKNVVETLKNEGLQPIVSLHHFTNPRWFQELGGWLNRDSVKYFQKYVQKIVESLGKDIKYWLTINEPLVYAYNAYLVGVWPPQERSWIKTRIVQENLLRAHLDTYRIIHEIYQKNNWQRPLVSIAKHLRVFTPCAFGIKPLNKVCAALRGYWFNYSFLDRLTKQKSLDFIGVNYYTRDFIRFWGLNFLGDNCKHPHHRIEKRSTLGWEIYPKGIKDILLKLKKYQLPILITENGVCAQDDALRWQFILEHLKYIKEALTQGIDVLGYLYWSLLDNFEWENGFLPRFGLIEVDYSTFKRTIRESARKFAQVCETNNLTECSNT